MPEINLPDVSLQWSSGGDILKPSDAKIQQGWQVEIPPRQWFNWLDNRQDEAIAHIAQHGIAVWSPTLEYQANKSFVQGSDGVVYKSITTHTNINPVGGAAGNWQSAFLTADQAVQVASAAQSRAMTANNVFLSPLQLANAFTGSNQSLSSTGYQKLPGGIVLQWGLASIATNSTGGSSTVSLPVPFTSQFFTVVGNYKRTGVVSDNFAVNTDIVSLTQFNIALDPAGVSTPPTGLQSAYWFAIGI